MPGQVFPSSSWENRPRPWFDELGKQLPKATLVVPVILLPVLLWQTALQGLSVPCGLFSCWGDKIVSHCRGRTSISGTRNEMGEPGTGGRQFANRGHGC